MGGPGRSAPFQFSAFIGMMGWGSMGLPIHKMKAEELAQIKRHGELFKSIRHVTCRGETHRLASIRENPYAAFEYVLPDKSEALLFLFAHGLRHNQRVPNILLEALDPEARYAVTIHGAPDDRQKAGRVVSGRALMEAGVLVDLSGDYDSRILYFTRSK